MRREVSDFGSFSPEAERALDDLTCFLLGHIWPHLLGLLSSRCADLPLRFQVFPSSKTAHLSYLYIYNLALINVFSIGRCVPCPSVFLTASLPSLFDMSLRNLYFSSPQQWFPLCLRTCLCKRLLTVSLCSVLELKLQESTYWSFLFTPNMVPGM